MSIFRKLKGVFDGRDLFCFIGFGLLYFGLAGKFGHDLAMIVTGVIILLKGLTKWV